MSDSSLLAGTSFPRELSDLAELSMRRGKARAILAKMTAEQREAVATYVEGARPWFDLGLDADSALTPDDVVCYLCIIAEDIRLQCGRRTPPTVPIVC